MKDLPAGLMDPNFEFFVYHGDIFMLSNGRVTAFRDLPEHLLVIIHNDLVKHPEAIEALHMMGVTEHISMLERWIVCRYGNFDHHADLTPEGISISEHTECPSRGGCKYEGTLCLTPETHQGKLSTREIDIIQEIAKGIPNKCIGDELGISQFTVNAHIRNIQQKTGSLNKAQIVAWASDNNLL